MRASSVEGLHQAYQLALKIKPIGINNLFLIQRGAVVHLAWLHHWGIAQRLHRQRFMSVQRTQARAPLARIQWNPWAICLT
ncbi:hypothetical protein [Pseudomonas sp. MH9.3]|uniref:hypothetical protein n=1 Tax=Pseudomonas sp. MH9.3 TaxID=3048630 RepID=UPI002AC9CC06|nr:hypothetical protein [Pseudomonas sp. MH9.3]MEB0106847.1 hypothetical protein [Pseudomonas sp. MH9.3]WPX80535.1 hypothetical protein RHM60_05325 [Pseudomonas sp. MH9.3]